DPKQAVFGVWELHPVQDLKGIENKNYEHTLQILNDYDLKLIINYSNSKGQLFSNSIQDMLFHIINHSTYHRGQIATEFKRQGLEPLVTDYIFFKR
ncbi:MAG TPA: DinB family protein, partial [Flavobacterium sp.]|nr:DinB family protein [Flavobacterium sp.]